MHTIDELTPAAQRVVDVAEGLIQRHGINGFSYDDIARQIGIKKPSIHHHFPAKSTLVAVVARRYMHRFMARLEQLERTHTSARERLLAYAGLFEQTYAENRKLCVCGMLGSEADDLPADVAAPVKEFFEGNLRWLSHVIASGIPPISLLTQQDVHNRAMMLLCALEGAMLVGRGLASDQSPARIAPAMITHLLS
jgi:TetR/AcrR family transcriptional regulator, transcriptional repressor for nem operon